MYINTRRLYAWNSAVSHVAPEKEPLLQMNVPLLHTKSFLYDPTSLTELRKMMAFLVFIVYSILLPLLSSVLKLYRSTNVCSESSLQEGEKKTKERVRLVVIQQTFKPVR